VGGDARQQDDRMTKSKDTGEGLVEVGYRITAQEGGGWALTLRVSGLPSGLLADQMGLTLVAVVRSALNPATMAQKDDMSH
jgi:hypothetical protein